MFKREYVPVLTKIILLSCMVLMGQGPCFPNRECTLATDCDDSDPCTNVECLSYTCVYTDNQDADDDGYLSEVCGGYDCDDSNPDVYPDAPEICDGVDNQCPGDVGYGDVDETHDGMAMYSQPAASTWGTHFGEGDVR